METQNKWFRRVVAVALIASLIMNATIAVVFASWRDYATAQAKVIEELHETIAQQSEAIEVLATGACYGLVANYRIDYGYAYPDETSSTSDIVLDGRQFQGCISILMELTAQRMP